MFPQFRSDNDGPPGTLMQGNGTSTLNGLPASNGDFGINSVTHLFEGATLGVSPLEVFYAAGRSNHASGGPPGYFHKDDPAVGGQVADHNYPWPTPNWFYYYDQVWKNQWGIPVVFWTGAYSYWLASDPTHVHIGNEAHGLSSVQTDLFAIPPGGAYVQQVGAERTRGIDTYIRVATHEAVHARLNANSTAGVNDNDPHPVTLQPIGDKVPDAIELQVGLDPNNLNTASFSYGGDNEVFARMCEHNLFATGGQVQQDWADDGLNKGNSPPPNLTQSTDPSNPLADPSVWNYPDALSLVP